MSWRDSEAVVAMDVRGACLLCARGTCWPVRYGESNEESVYKVRSKLVVNRGNKRTSVIASHCMPNRSQG